MPPVNCSYICRDGVGKYLNWKNNSSETTLQARSRPLTNLRCLGDVFIVTQLTDTVAVPFCICRCGGPEVQRISSPMAARPEPPNCQDGWPGRRSVERLVRRGGHFMTSILTGLERNNSLWSKCARNPAKRDSSVPPPDAAGFSAAKLLK